MLSCDVVHFQHDELTLVESQSSMTGFFVGYGELRRTDPQASFSKTATCIMGVKCYQHNFLNINAGCQVALFVTVEYKCYECFDCEVDTYQNQLYACSQEAFKD